MDLATTLLLDLDFDFILISFWLDLVGFGSIGALVAPVVQVKLKEILQKIQSRSNRKSPVDHSKSLIIRVARNPQNPR